MSKSLQRGILFSICVALILAIALTLAFFAGGGDKNILSAPEGQVSNAAKNTTSYTHGSNIGRQVPAGVKTVSTGLDFITAVSDNESVSLAGDITLGWNEFGIQAEGISGGWSVDTYTGTIYGNGYTVTFDGLKTTSEVYPADRFNNKPYAGGIVRELGDELGNGGAIYDLNVSVNGHIRVLGASGQYLDLGILVGQMNSNSVIDNCTVTVNNGKSVESMKMSSSIPWARLGLFVGKFADNASNMRITNVTATHNGTIEVGLGTTSGWGGTPGGGNTDESSQGFAGLIFGAASKSATNITLDNIVVAGSGEIWSYAGAPIGMLMGNTAVTINNFFNKTTNGSLFNNISDNRSSNTILDFERNGDNVQGRVVNHYRSSHAQQATADDNNGINVTNTITVSDDNIGKIYFDPKVSDYANSLTIVHDTSNRPVDSANERTYTITGQNNYSATSEEITLNGSYDRVIFRNLSSTASNWNNSGNFGYSVTYKDTPIFQIPKDLIPFYEHGYVAGNSATGMEISSGTEFESAFANGGNAVSGNYYLSKDIAISGFYGESFSGTLDGNGHTIYITGARQEGYGNAAVGGLTGTLTGTIKNVRVVLVDEAGEVSLIKNNDDIKSSRIGVLVGKVDRGTLENVQVVVESGATLKADMTTAGNDHDMAMGGVVGGTNNATLRGVTMELNGKLDPHGSWTFVGAMAGKIEGTTTFENVVLRGNGTLAGHATNGASNSGQPVFAGALGVTSISSTSPTQTVTVNGLIYDFDVTLAGTMRDGAAGNSNGSYSCYYILTNNYNDGMTGGDVTESAPISQYNGAASYSNVFIASDYVTELEGYAKFRTNGNAPIGLGSTTPYTIARNVSSAAGRYDDASVTAYFQPVTTTIGTSYNYEAGDLVLKVSGHAWAADESLMVNVGGDTGSVISYLEDPASTSSDRIVALSKDEAVAAAQGNSNTVQVREFRHVAQPQLADELTYTGSGIEVAFVVRYESESGAGQMGEELPSSAYTVSIEKKEGGTGSVVDGKPVNAGEYVATITLTRGDTFLGSGTGGDSDTATVEFTVAPYLVEGTWELSGLTLTYGDPVPSDIDQYIRVTLTSQNIPGGLDAVKAKGFTTDYVQGAPAGTTVNITAGTYTMDASLTASNYDLSGIKGSGSVKVQKKTLTIDPVSTEPDHMHDPHISAVYGATGDKAAVQGMLDWDAIEKYIKGNYNGEEVSFTIDKIYIAAFDETGAFTLENAEEVADENVASLGANSYLITVTADGDNYTFAEGEFFVYGVIPAPLTVTGVAFEGDFDGVYDGQAHNVTVQYSGELVGGDAPYNFGISINEIDGISVTDAGDYVVTVQADEKNANYDINFENDVNEYAVTISPITLTISDKSGVYTELTAADIVIADMVSGILEGDKSGVTITPVWDTQPADENEYLAAGTYNATLSLSGDKSDNYTFGTDNVATVKVDPFDLHGAFVTITSEQFTFDGTEKTVEYTVLTAEGGKDITALLTPAGNKQTNANNNYTLTLTGGDNFTGTATAPWSIGKRTLSVTEPTALTFLDKKTSELYAYLTTGNWITGFVGSDSYTGNLWVNNPADNAVPIGDVAYAAAGTYTLSINLSGNNADNNYALSVNELSVTINPFDLSGAEMTVGALTYNGAEQTAPVTVTANGVDVTSLLTVSGNTATAAGSNYTAKAEAQDGNFIGSIEKPFTVAQKQLKLESLTLSSSTYTGEAITVAGHTFAEGFAPAGDEQPELSIVEETGATVQDAGTYTFDVTLKEASTYPVNANYVIAADGAKITATVSPASVTVTAAQEAKIGVDFGGIATPDTSRFYDSDFITLSAQPDETFTLSSALTFIVKNSETQEEVRSAEGSYRLAPGTYTVTYTINNIEGANYTLIAYGELTTTLTVEEGARKLAITGWNNTSPTYDGTAQLPTPVFADSVEIEQLPEGALVYEVTAKEGSTLTGEGAVNAGAYTVTVSIAPDFAGQYELAGDNLSTEFTIGKLEVILEWEAADDLVYNGERHTAAATVFNKVDDDVVEVTVGLVNGNDNRNVGEFFYEATGLSGADAGNYSLPAEKRHSFTVTPAQVELTWNFKENATIVYGDGVEAVKALVDIAALKGTIPGAEAPLTFEVSVGDYSATTGAGTEVTFTVTYTLPEGAQEKNYHITVEAAGGDKLEVGKAVLNLVQADTASLTKVYDGAAVTLGSLLTADNVVVKGMKNGENAFDLNILSISGTEQEMTDAAVYDGIVIEIIKDCNYIAADLKIIYKITPKPIGVDWSNTELTYDGTAQAPTATATGLVGSESLTLTVSGAQTDANAEGQPYTATVTAESVTGNYKLEENATVEFTIARKIVSVAWSNTQLTYNGSEQEPTATVGEGLVSGDDLQITVRGAQTDAGDDYTATAAITGGADMDNYVLDESASTTFTITPKSVSVTLTADSGDTINFDVAGSVKAGAWTADGDNKATLTLSDGAGTVTLTAEAQEALPLIEGVPALVLLLDNAPYEGTPYGTKVEGGKLTVISADPNYVFEVAQEITVNITPAITVSLKAGVQTTVALDVVLGDTYNAEYFKNNYFQVTGKDGTEVTGGTLEVTITPSEGLEEGAIKHAGAYTVKAEYTPAGAQEGAELPNYSFTFTVTPVEVTSVTYSGEARTYGALGASGEITVTVEYADGTKAENVTAQYASANVSTGGWLKAGSTQVTVNYAGENSDYAAVKDHAVTLSIEKLDITATLTYAEQSGTSLTLPYNGRTGYSVGAELLGIKDGDGVSAYVDGDFVDVQENISATVMLDGDDKDNYNVTGTYSVTITPAQLNITVEAAESTYTGQPIALNVKAGEGEIFPEDKVTFTVSGEGVENNAVTNAGAYELTVATAGAQGDNYTIVDPSASVEIAKADVTIVWSEQTEFVYSGVAVVPSADVRFNGSSVGTATVIITEGKAINVGHYTAVANFAGAENFNEVISEVYDFNITPAQLNITVEAAESTYTGQPITLTVKAGEGEIFADDEVTFTVSGEGVENNAVTNAGTYELTVATAGAQGGNYTIVDPSASVEIAKANVTIVWGEQREFVYSGVAVVPSADVQFNDESVGTATVTCDGDFITEGNKAINIGHYTAVANFAGTENFNAASDSFAFQITMATLTVTPGRVSFSEHDADKMAAYAKDAFANTIADLITVIGVEAEGEISNFNVTDDPDRVTYQPDGEHKGVWLAVGVHEYSITAANGNYEPFTFTVEVTAQEMITITATPDSPVYTGSEIGFTYTKADGTEFDMTGVTVEIASVEVTLPSASESSITDVVKDAGTYKVTFTVTAQDDTYYYAVTSWTGDIEQAPVSVQQAAGVYGQIVLTANGTISGTFTTPFVVFNGQPVDVTVAYDGAASGAALLAEGDSFLAAGDYDATVSLNDHNFKWEDNASNKPGSFVVDKKTVKLDYTPSSTSFSASGISFTLEDHTAAQVGEDSLTVQIVIDGVPVDPLDPPVLNAGTHTVTYRISGSGVDNYDFKPVEETFTLAARKLDPEITVDGQDEISNGGTLNMTVGEQRNIMSAINGYLDRNSVPASDRTITVSGGKDLAAVSTWEPGTYTVTVAFSGNHDGSMTFTVTVSEQAPLPEIPDAPVLPETPLTEAEDGGAGWLFPLLIAIVALIDVALVVAIIIVAKKRA